MIAIGKSIYTTPYFDLMPPLTLEENQILTNSIKEKGILVPVVIDESNNILDGHNRLRIAAELGLTDIVFDIRPGLTDDEKRDLAIRLNRDRRHLKPEQWQALKLRRNGKTLQAIGEELGVDTSTAKRLIDSAFASSAKAELPSTAVGKDGKQYPTKYKPRSVFVRNNREAQQAIKIFEDVDDLPETAFTLADLKRERKRQDRQGRIEAVEAAELPLDKFHVIVVDPPWSYGRQSDPTHRSANPYQQMTVMDICAMPVAGLAHENCILWLWTTNAYMREAYQVVDAWGFQVKTILTWVKDRMGTGDWLRGQTEHCLMAIKGRPVVNLTNQTTAINGPLREHSRKPDEFFELVNTLCPGKKAELFARTNRQGWTVYGDQLHTF